MKKVSSGAKINNKQPFVDPLPGDVALSMVGNPTIMAPREGESGVDLLNGILMAEEAVDNILQRIDDRIETVETVKKIPDFNSDLAVE